MSKLDFVRFSFQLFREKKIFFFFTSECYVCVTFDHFWMKINFNQILIKSGEKIRSTHTHSVEKKSMETCHYYYHDNDDDDDDEI